MYRADARSDLRIHAKHLLLAAIANRISGWVLERWRTVDADEAAALLACSLTA